MDIRIKRFALSAIATAILSLTAEQAQALSCPAFIVGTSLAGVVCEFDSVTGSTLTVANGGVVGAITMTSYTPTPPSSLTIDVGGTINNATSAAIIISSSSLSNGLSNSGTISSGSSTAISINSSNISGGISNNGLISAGGNGISIFSSIINNGLSNQGTINTTNGTGILINSSSAINGNLSNSGTISTGGLFTGVSILGGSVVDGDLTNSGLIESTGSGNAIIMRSNAVLTGGITNTGTIRSANNTGINILNSSIIFGSINNSGTISTNNHGLFIHNGSVVAGQIINNGTINSTSGNGIAILSNTTINGGISNSGSIIGGSTGISVTSTSVINGALSNSGIIQGSNKAIFVNADSTVNQISILGNSSRIIGSVDAVNSTIDITSGATFTSEGTFNVNLFNINSNATFNIANTITTNTLNNAGTLAVGNAVNTVAGNYQQNAGGRFQLGITNTTNYGALAISGALDLSASGNINVQIANNSSLHTGDVFTNVISGSTLTTPTSGYQVSDNSFIWKFTASTNSLNTGVNLVASIDPAAYTACQGSYCQGAAQTILNQINAGNTAFNAFNTLSSSSAFQRAAQQVTPELTNENIGMTQGTAQAVRDTVPMWASLHGQSAGDAMISDPGKVWFKPYAATIIQDQNNSVQGYSGSTYGAVFGKDISVSEWLFGGALAAGKENVRGKAQLSGQTLNGDIYQGILYGARKLPNRLYVAAQGLLGYGNNDTGRSIPLYSSTAKGSFHSWFTNLRTQLGWNFEVPEKNLVLTPQLDASFLYVNQGSYRESGSTMNLNVNSSNNSSLILGAYANAAYHLMPSSKLEYVTLTAYAGFARNLINNQPQTTATFLAGGPSFTTPGTQFNNTVFRGGVGVDITNPAKPLRANINYDLQTGNNAYSGTGSVTIIYKL